MSNTAPKAKVVIERSYPASLEEIWELWTTKEGFESWWGPVGFRVEVNELKAQVGGVLRYDMIADTSEMVAAMKRMGRPPSHPTIARFTEFRPHERLVVTNVIDFLPQVAAYEIQIAVDFSLRGDRVHMVVTLDPLHTEEMSGMQKQGFESQLTKLDERFASNQR